MSPQGYDIIINKLEAERLQKEAELERTEQNALMEMETQKRKQLEQAMESAQNFIYTLCDTTVRNYKIMVDAGRDMLRNEKEIDKLEKEQKVRGEIGESVLYPILPLDESKELRMKWRMISYKSLPIIDTFFAFFAINNILTHKLVNSFPGFEVFMLVAAIMVSIFAGWFLSTISRMACASLNPDSPPAKEFKKRIGVILSSFILPAFYIVGEWSFSDQRDWAFACGFAAVSFIIQYVMICSFKEYEEAKEYFRIKTENMKMMTAKEADEKAIHGELAALKNKEEMIMNRFNSAYEEFEKTFRDLVIARDEFVRKFEKEVLHSLGQVVIYVGNLLCFRDERFPFNRNQEGLVTVLQPVGFHGVNGCIALGQSDELILLNGMLRRRGGMSMDETIRQIEEQSKKSTAVKSPDAHLSPDADAETRGAADDSSDNTDDTSGIIW